MSEKEKYEIKQQLRMIDFSFEKIINKISIKQKTLNNAEGVKKDGQRTLREHR